MGISLAGVGLAVLVMTPLTYAVLAFAPRLAGVLKALTLLPYAVPGVISATGAAGRLWRAGHPDARGAGGRVLCVHHAADVFGHQQRDARHRHCARKRGGACAGCIYDADFSPDHRAGRGPGHPCEHACLSFSMLFGEFVVANMLIGGSFETVQIYLYQIMKQTGHLSSALVLIYVLIMTLICAAVIRLTDGQSTQQAERRQTHEPVH